MATNWGLLQGGGPASRSLGSVLGGYEAGVNVRQQQEQEQQDQEMDKVAMRLEQKMRDPTFELDSSPLFGQLMAERPEVAEAYATRHASMQGRQLDEYVQDMTAVRSALQRGDQNDAYNILGDRIEMLESQGRDDTDSVRMLRILEEQGPEAALMGLDQMVAAQQGQYTPMSSNIQEKKVGRFKTIDTGNEIIVFDSATDEEIRRYPKTQSGEDKAEEERAKLESELTAQELETERRKQREDMFAVDEGIELTQEAASLADNLLNNEDLDNIVGISESLPTVRPGSKSLVRQASRLKSLLTKDNLGLMSGVLSESDIKILSEVGSSLNVTEGGIEGDIDYVAGELERIRNKLQGKARNKRTQLDKDLFVGKFSPMLDRKIKQEDIRAIRKKGYSTQEIYNRLKVDE